MNFQKSTKNINDISENKYPQKLNPIKYLRENNIRMSTFWYASVGEF